MMHEKKPRQLRTEFTLATGPHWINVLIFIPLNKYDLPTASQIIDIKLTRPCSVHVQ